MLRRTPCVGICTTTYGDLVCRGCKRFAHEIVQWNAFEDDQRSAVWRRLLTLRAGAVMAVLEIRDEALLRAAARRLGLDAADQDPYNVLYETLRRLQWRESVPGLDTLGVQARPGQEGAAGIDAWLAHIDQEYWERSVADYERSYRIPAR
jgi:uncharacterized protein